MGQPITVLEKQSSRPGILRFELNRPLSGMGHERWVEGDLVEGERPVDEMARRVLAHGGVDAVHVNGSVITVTLARGSSGAGLGDVVRGLFRFYPDTVPAAATDAPDGAGEAADAVASSPAEGHAESEADPAADPAAVAAEEPAPPE